MTAPNPHDVLAVLGRTAQLLEALQDLADDGAPGITQALLVDALGVAGLALAPTTQDLALANVAALLSIDPDEPTSAHL